MGPRAPRGLTRLARKRLGQHFLEPVWVRKVVEAIDPQPGDFFLEIGAGPGILTFPLAEASAGVRVLAVEIDPDLVARLAATAPPSVDVLQGDVLALDLKAELRARTRDAQRVRIAGNLPYYITSPILTRVAFLSTQLPLADATLLVQQEVGDRLVAAAGTREYGVLTIRISLDADVQQLLTLPPGAFRPAPRVASRLIRLVFRPPPVDVGDRQVLDAVVCAAFQQRRKTLANALKAHAGSATAARQALARAGIAEARRPETLTLEEFARLARAFGRGLRLPATGEETVRSD